MSSSSARIIFKDFVGIQNPDLELVDMDEHFDSKDFPALKPFLGIQFIVSEEERVQIPDHYREEGRFMLHYVFNKQKDLSPRYLEIDLIRKKFRGKRSGALVMDNVEPQKLEFLKQGDH